MPTYEYRCGECGAREEHTHSITQSFTPRCPKDGRWMRLVIQSPAIVFKGEGFAKKDRAKKDGK